MSPTRSDILEAVARGWCHGSNRYKTMDSTLAEAIADEVFKALSPPSAAAVHYYADRAGEAACDPLDRSGTHSDDVDDVTCIKCLRVLAAQPKAPSPSEYGPLIPSLGPIKMPEPDQELPPFYTKPPAGEGV